MVKSKTSFDIKTLLKGLVSGKRSTLARAITLVESTRKDHQIFAQQLLEKVLSKTGSSIRIGISGVPGVGKSTFIENFGLFMVNRGYKVAVLAVDPSSKRAGGSILGDKIRMEELSRSNFAFIRPSPTGGSLGGVARRTRESMLLCEAASYDVIIVETVGVGQSETSVADMVDMFILLLLPGGGDEIQGLKKGIIELSDLLIVNKADGDLENSAKITAQHYRQAIHFVQPSYPEWDPKVITCSSLDMKNMKEIWSHIGAFQKIRKKNRNFSKHRKNQASIWMWSEINESLNDAFRGDQRVKKILKKIELNVMSGKMTPRSGVKKLLEVFLK